MADVQEDMMDLGARGEGDPTAVEIAETVVTSGSSEPSQRDMLMRVAHSDSHFKHQLRGEPDLTILEKLEIATEILDKNPVTFLERFGKVMLEQDLSYFDDKSNKRGQYDVTFHLREIRKHLGDAKNKQIVRNRRYEAMKKLMLDTDYFGDEEMKARNPYLYDQLVGQYLSEEEIKQQAQSNETLSQMFMHHLQGMKNTELYDYLKDREVGVLS